MKCTYCGTENGEAYKFCQKCGAQLEYIMEKPQRKRSIPWKKVIIMGGIGVVAVFAAVLTNILFLQKSPYSLMENNVLTVYQLEEDTTYFVRDGMVLPDSVKEGLSEQQQSLGGSVLAVKNYDSDLFLIIEDALREIAEDVSEFELSVTGEGLAYVDEEGTLILYNVKSGENTKIVNEITDEFDIVISPDGNSVGYLVKEDEAFILCVYANGKEVEIGESLYPIGISNGGKYIYCLNWENDGLYVASVNGDSKKLAAEMGDQYILNNQHTQLLFFAKDKGYVVNKDEEKVKITNTDEWITLVAPDYLAQSNSLRAVMDLSVVTKGVEKLSEQYYCQDDLFYIDKDWNKDTKLSNIDAGDCRMTQSGKVIFYEKGNKLYKVDKGDFSKALQIAEDVSEYRILGDGKAVYFTDFSDTLWYQKGVREAKKIAEDVHSITMSYDGYALFLTDYGNGSGILYTSKKGNEKEQLCDDTSIVIPKSTATYYYANSNSADYTSDLYGAKGKTDFSLIIEGIY